jgi:hypothetical protein
MSEENKLKVDLTDDQKGIFDCISKNDNGNLKNALIVSIFIGSVREVDLILLFSEL